MLKEVDSPLILSLFLCRFDLSIIGIHQSALVWHFPSQNTSSTGSLEEKKLRKKTNFGQSTLDKNGLFKSNRRVTRSLSCRLVFLYDKAHPSAKILFISFASNISTLSLEIHVTLSCAVLKRDNNFSLGFF